MYETNPYFYGTGRRKESVARVRLYVVLKNHNQRQRPSTFTLVFRKTLLTSFVSHSLLLKQAKSLM